MARGKRSRGGVTCRERGRRAAAEAGMRLPWPLTFFLTAGERRRVLAALRRVGVRVGPAAKERALLRVLRVRRDRQGGAG